MTGAKLPVPPLGANSGIFLLEASGSVSGELSWAGPLLDQARIGLHRCAADGTILGCSPAVIAIAGYRVVDELVGRSIHALYTDREATEEMLRRLTLGEPLHEYQTRLATKDGSIRHVVIDATAAWKDGRVDGSHWLVRDVTMRVQTAKGKDAALSREESARRQAEEANRLKDEFLATMSHELRTPLSAILGWVQLLRERTFDQRTLERGIETIERNARVQSKIVEDMLDVSRIITGKLLLRARIVEVNAVVMEAIDVVRPTADAKGVRIVVDLDPSVGVIRADPERLQQIVWNLLVNAIRFTPKGGKIDAIVTRKSEWVSIEIRDTGRGISSDFLPYIWERFRQADSTTTRRSGGLGLGLAIVRHLTEAHGGFAHAESEGEGRGATFRVTLPLASLEIDSGEFETTRPDWPVPAVPGRELQGLNVLIAEDDADTRELLVMMLRDRGAVVTSTSSAEEALARLPEQKYDVIVSDVGMPNLDGYDLIRRIRAMPPEEGGTIPAIALTAYASSEDRKKALLAGFQIHVPKPVSVRDLVAVVVNATSRGK